MDSLNVVGAGKVARVLARLWHESGTFRVAGVLTRSRQTAAAAVAFIGAGTAAVDLERLGPAQAWMLGVNDDQIEPVAAALAALGLVRPGDLVFHLSGALAAEALAPLRALGARTASVHPVKSIVDPLSAYRGFVGTPVAVEGDPEACAALRERLEPIGALHFPLEAAQKLRYHAATSICCNLLHALLDIGLEVYELAGLDRVTAARIVAPLLTESLDNGLRLGPAAALTGPIARGDAGVVAAHLAQLPAPLQGAYRELGIRAVALAVTAGKLSPAQAERLSALLDPRPA